MWRAIPTTLREVSSRAGLVARSSSLLAIAALAVGCAGARYGGSFRSSMGTALAKPGVSGGTTNSIRVADVGGPLARAGVLGLATLAAAGSVKTETTVEKWQVGDYEITETTTKIVGYDEAAMKASAALLESAASSQPMGLQASLEIATRYLGGDTSGWMYNLGYGSEPFICGPHLVCFFYGGFGFGKYTFHDRTMRTVEDTTVVEAMGDSSSYYVGTPLRLTIAPVDLLRFYVQADLNLVTATNLALGESGSPSPWHAGVELHLGIVFGRLGVSSSRMTRESTSTMLEVGLGF